MEHVDDSHLKLRPDSGLDCLMCAIFARQRRDHSRIQAGMLEEGEKARGALAARVITLEALAKQVCHI